MQSLEEELDRFIIKYDTIMHLIKCYCECSMIKELWSVIVFKADASTMIVLFVSFASNIMQPVSDKKKLLINVNEYRWYISRFTHIHNNKLIRKDLLHEQCNLCTWRWTCYVYLIDLLIDDQQITLNVCWKYLKTPIFFKHTILLY